MNKEFLEKFSSLVLKICVNLQKEINSNNLQNNITVLCMDGLKNVEDKLNNAAFNKKVNVVLIAGMGGMLICDILKSYLKINIFLAT